MRCLPLRLVLAASPVLIAACALPARDNPKDPNNTPDVFLRVALRSVDSADGACPAYVPGEEDDWQETYVASRGACVVLDARASEDPQGDRLSFQWLYSTSPSLPLEEMPEAWLELAATTGTGAALALLQPAALLQFPLDRPMRLLARGVARGDEVGLSNEYSFQALNAAPVARLNPPRAYPLGGYAESPGADFAVTFDASATTDADGEEDVLTYTWDLSGGYSCATPGLETCTITVPSAAASRIAAGVVATDPSGASSGRTVTEAYVRVPETWAYRSNGAIDGITLVPIDPSYESGIPDVSNPVLAGAVTETRSLVISGLDGTVLYLLDAGGATLDSLDPVIDLANGDEPFRSVALDAAANRAWAVAPMTSTNFSFSRKLLRLDTTGDNLVELDFQSLAPAIVPPFSVDPIALDAGGNAWAAAALSTQLTIVTGATGAIADTLTNASDEAITGIASRFRADGAQLNEVWTTTSRAGFGNTQSATPTVQQWNALDHSLLGQWDVPESDLVGIHWVDDDAFWTQVPGQALLLVDATRMDQPWPAPVLVRVPEAADAWRIAVDPVSGAAHAFARDTVTYVRAETDGRVEVVPLPLPLRALGIRGDGLLVVASDTKVLAGRSVPPGEANVLPIISVSVGSVDPRGGATWVSSYDPPSLRAFAIDGTPLDLISEIDLGGGTYDAFPIPLAVTVAPGGAEVWFAGYEFVGNQVTTSVYRLDVAAPRDPAFPWRAAGERWISGTDYIYPPVLFGKSAGGQLWVQGNPTIFTDSVALLDDQGTLTDVFVVPDAASEDVAEGRSGIDGMELWGTQDSVCVVTEARAGTTWTVRLYRVVEGEAPPVAPFVSFTRTSAAIQRVVSASAVTSGPDLCWVALEFPGGTGELLAFDTAGVAVVSEPLTTLANPPINSIRPIDTNLLFVARGDQIAPALIERWTYNAGTTNYDALSYPTDGSSQVQLFGR